MENREDYLPSYEYKIIFCFSPAITIVFTPSFAAAILDEVEMIVDIGPLKINVKASSYSGIQLEKF